ncbi:MBL fold metallo-hydrolase [Candidatus Woesearchaeota archaeon]|jgi:ribonuclease J|nr:MBL fold metallo-hydrolase [Candidatus Woesearchaeota archaeon]MBT4434005.1 MBL fold metallo-hydrolase [Candidatus Woesearchaeota archaeon]
MPIEICTIGGFSKTEGNSVAIKVDDEVVLLDMGLSMENYIKHQEDREDVRAEKTYKELIKVEAVPNYSHIKDWMDKVVVIAPSHGHLDHVGAIPFAASLFPKATVVSTPYTIEILRAILKDERINLPNEIVSIKLNGTYKVSDKITLEFVEMTHSIPHTATIVVHTPYGKIAYANDFKLDHTPVIGKPPNMDRLKAIGKEGVDVMFMDCLYADTHIHTPSEKVAKQLLQDVMLGTESQGKAMIVTTFSSQISRLKSIIEMGKKLNRKIVFLGRSLNKYVTAAEKINLVKFTQDVKMYSRRHEVEKILRKIQKEGPDKYLIVCTGHQGEPRAILSRIVKGELDYKLKDGDIVIFSCRVIPVETNIRHRAKLDSDLKKKGVRIFKDVHVSGHGALEDHRDLLECVRPKLFMPIHAEPAKARMLIDFAKPLGFKGKGMIDGGRFVVK